MLCTSLCLSISQSSIFYCFGYLIKVLLPVRIAWRSQCELPFWIWWLITKSSNWSGGALYKGQRLVYIRLVSQIRIGILKYYITLPLKPHIITRLVLFSDHISYIHRSTGTYDHRLRRTGLNPWSNILEASDPLEIEIRIAAFGCWFVNSNYPACQDVSCGFWG